jgi:geranylgeranyl pyrophosphate synthase
MVTLLANPVQERLQQVEALLYAQVDSRRSGLPSALSQLLASGGKRIRPRIALLTASLLGAQDDQSVLLAAAIEMLHTATLIHDDLVDGALLRRGIATLNARYSSALTVLAGDFAFARAAKLASETASTPVMRLFTETLSIMTDGELTQASRDRGIASRLEYYAWIHAKTASLFELATGAAALLSPVEDRLVAAAREFGHELGMAFQIVDDVLDFTGDPHTLGKPTGSDLRQGVITLPALYFLETHPADADILQIIRDRKGQDDSRLDRLVAAIRRNGAIHQALSEAENFVQRALVALNLLPDTSERDALAEIARSVVHRDA